MSRFGQIWESGHVKGGKELNRRANGAIPYLNVKLALSQRLLDLTSKEHPLRVRRLLAEIPDEHPEEDHAYPKLLQQVRE